MSNNILNIPKDSKAWLIDSKKTATVVVATNVDEAMDILECSEVWASLLLSTDYLLVTKLKTG